ncbi:MAG: flagellar protein [Planctomycetota bacterium]|nr:MAG: flagellar protein [Planctomycetota bacterium]
MISLTRLNGQPFVLNAELIRTIEQTPDTTITLVNGDHIVVQEPVEEVVERVVEYQRSLRALLPPD